MLEFGPGYQSIPTSPPTLTNMLTWTLEKSPARCVAMLLPRVQFQIRIEPPLGTPTTNFVVLIVARLDADPRNVQAGPQSAESYS